MGLLPEQVAIVFIGKTLKKIDDIINHKTEFDTPQKIILGT